MVRQLQAWGVVRDTRALAAMARVPRELFVPHFWASPDHVPGDLREWRVGEGSPTALDLVYDIDLALGLRLSRGPSPEQGLLAGERLLRRQGAGMTVTSTASAPRVVAWMLDLLELRPGQRVLEVGTGSGYNAALLSELVGPEGAVTTVDIDAGLVARASHRLAAAGYGDVRTLVADGYFGCPEHAPFDRVVATVGCVDVAPAWLGQLAPGGFCLLPLQHGSWHPLARVAGAPRRAAMATGRLVGRTSFVDIQGRQSAPLPWPPRGLRSAVPVMTWSPLPERLARSLWPGPDREGLDVDQVWDLALFLALEDRRASFLRLLGDGSVAALEPSAGRVGYAGPDGPALRDRALEVAELWSALGQPAIGDYEIAFFPRDRASATRGAPAGGGTERPATAGAAPPTRAGPGRGQWVVERFDFCQVLSLAGTGAGGGTGQEVPGSSTGPEVPGGSTGEVPGGSTGPEVPGGRTGPDAPGGRTVG